MRREAASGVGVDEEEEEEDEEENEEIEEEENERQKAEDEVEKIGDGKGDKDKVEDDEGLDKNAEQGRKEGNGRNTNNDDGDDKQQKLEAGEYEGEEDEDDDDSQWSTPLSYPVRGGASYLPPPGPFPRAPLASIELLPSDVYIHFEVREETGWWLPGQEGQMPSPVLYSALLCLGDFKGLERSLYHDAYYNDEELPGMVLGRVAGGAREGAAAVVEECENTALAAYLNKTRGDPDSSLILDTAAIHVPTGRVVRLHE